MTNKRSAKHSRAADDGPAADLVQRIRFAARKPTRAPAGLARYVRGARISPGRVIVGANTTVTGRGRWNVDGAKLTIGVNGMSFSDETDRTVVRNDGTISIRGHVRFNQGSRIVVREGANLRIGSGTFINPFTIIEASNLIEIGSDCAISWRCDVIDTSFHQLDYLDRRTESNVIHVGDHVWVGAGARLLPGADLGDGCVVAAGSTVGSSFPPGSLIGGSPARVLRSDVSWSL